MKNRLIGGFFVVLAGIILILLSIWITFIFLIYGLPCLVIGIVILLNHNEDKIEKIKYKEVKHEK